MNPHIPNNKHNNHNRELGVPYQIYAIDLLHKYGFAPRKQESFSLFKEAKFRPKAQVVLLL